jgi:hypothetical protein
MVSHGVAVPSAEPCTERSSETATALAHAEPTACAGIESACGSRVHCAAVARYAALIPTRALQCLRHSAASSALCCALWQRARYCAMRVRSLCETTYGRSEAGGKQGSQGANKQIGTTEHAQSLCHASTARESNDWLFGWMARAAGLRHMLRSTHRAVGKLVGVLAVRTERKHRTRDRCRALINRKEQCKPVCVMRSLPQRDQFRCVGSTDGMPCSLYRHTAQIDPWMLADRPVCGP